MNFNDTILSIEILDEEEMIDIEVSDDHLFYGNDILVSNSIGIPGVCDLMLAVTRNEEMDNIGQITCKQLKNRFRNMIFKPRFILGTEFDQQLLFDVNEGEQTLVESAAIPSSSSTQEKFESAFKSKMSKRNFKNIDIGD
jgi:hypothetical protein